MKVMLKRDEVNTLMFGHCVPEGNECVKSVKRIEEVKREKIKLES